MISAKKALAVTTSLVCALVLLMFATGCQQDSGQIAAKFGSHTISEDEVTSYTDSFRAKNDLKDDASWAEYLTEQGLSTSEWREEAIRTLADRILIEDKAEELGITADEATVSQQIAEDKQNAGISEDDEDGWRNYLAEKGSTPESLKADYEYDSIEEQVFKKELNFSNELEDEMCDDYIKTNLADQIVHHYEVIVYKKSEKKKAQAQLAEFSQLSGKKLRTAFEKVMNNTQTTLSSGAKSTVEDWDFVYSGGVIDPNDKLRKANLEKGELYPKLLKGTDGYRLVLCIGKADLAVTPKYEQIKDSSLKSLIEKLTMASTWSGKCQQYLSDLEDQADIQVSPMPEGLSYDVLDDTESSSSSE